MYSDKKNILQLVSLLKGHNVRRIVVCPGSRNAPIVNTLVNCSFFTCYPVTDERSAGFFAIGLALKFVEPIAVCCTSGSALLNIHPAVSEAFYQNIPLIVISADRPSAWIGQKDGQTIPQPNVFGALVKKCVNIPEIHTDEDEWYCNRLVNEALLECTFHQYGPVHINISISEPLFQFNVDVLPKVRVIRRITVLDGYNKLVDSINKFIKYDKILIVVGQINKPLSIFTQVSDVLFTKCTWFAEHLANIENTNNRIIRNFDAALYAMTKDEKEKMVPDVVITLGGHVVSKRLKQYLRQHAVKEHIHVSSDGAIADLFCSLTTVIEQQVEDFVRMLSDNMVNKSSSLYSKQWEDICMHIFPPDFTYSEMSVIGSLIKVLPPHTTVHLANSSTVRYAQLFNLPPSVNICCNRGVNGIEGSLSTAVGYASADHNHLNFIIIGDLSFFYDMNALWNSNYASNIRIVLLNNAAGEIFQSLPGLSMTDASKRAIMATHNTSAKGWAEECGFEYLQVVNDEQLSSSLKKIVSTKICKRPVLMEVYTNTVTDVKILKNYYHQLKQK